MAEAKRRSDAWDATSAGSPQPRAEIALDHGCPSGGQVGRMQADLARRLDWGTAEAARIGTPAGERVVRFVSAAGGYAALLAGYGGVALLVMR